MNRTLLIWLLIANTVGLSIMAIPVCATGMFDWMSPNKWFNGGRDYDRDYYPRNYYGYPGYAYPGWGGYGYPGTYPSAFGYPGWGYPGYTYPVQPSQQSTGSAPASPPIPQ